MRRLGRGAVKFARWCFRQIRHATKKAIGHDSWREYAQTEFGMSQSQVYKILDQGRVVKAIQEAAGVSSIAENMSEYQARRLKPHLQLVTDEIGGFGPTPPKGIFQP